ncbi:LOW QUALITY PROTEIN: zinc finger protein 469 [Ursus americanus]|uniref:LOW QUALITY PROTEIN: zinc finger protein 469 n=1 Tax=Ursus americanus TaxID=9643 RepID=UPI001E67C92F|nr:LOW QUALITY PROTEIN: zinc finger protein 469 [Ursus americanus]
MPGQQPRRAPPPAMTRDLQPCPAARGTGGPSQPPGEDGAPASRTTKATGSRAHAAELPESQPWQAGEVEPKAPLLRTQSLSSLLGKGGSPRAPPGRSQTQAFPQQPGRADSSPQQFYNLNVSGSRARPTLDKTPEGPQGEDPGPPEAKAPPTPEELSFQRCFQETPSSFTSTNYTSPNAACGPPPLRAPPGSSASPCRPASYSEFQAGGADGWPPTVENSFPGARFGVPAAKPEPFPEEDSPRVVSFQYPFQALHGPGPKPFPEDTSPPKYGERALVFAFRQPRGPWPEEAVGTGTAYPLPTRPAPQPPPCYPGRPSLDPPSDLGCAPPQPGAAPPAPSPFSESTATFPDSLHKSLTKTLPERPPSAHDDRLGSPRGPPNSLSQRHFPGQTYGSPGASGVGTSPGSLDTELATPGPLPTRLPQLWDPAAAPYPSPPLGPPATTRNAFFEGQASLGQHLGLPQSPPLPWPQVLPATGPSPHRMEVLSQLPFPPGAPEWQGGSQGALGAAGKTPGPGEKLAVLRNSPGQHGGGSPGLFAYNGLKDPGAQPLFFGVAQSQVSPRATPGLPPPRVVGASPCESPLPSPATNTASSSSCSSLSPLSSSPANPSSEESQVPGPLGPPAFFHPNTHPPETGSPYPSPEPPHAVPMHYQPEPVRAFRFPAEGLGAEGTFKCLDEAPFPGSGPEVGSGGLEGFPREPPPYPAHHFPLSSASLDQLDVLLTCRQCDQNYSSLAAFLGHRQFCSGLLARAKEGHPQPPGPPGPPATPKAPAGGNLSLPGHTKTVPFLLGGDVRPDGKEDPLRTSFLPGLAAAPFPLPAADLDPEDDAKLDSLITEALNGLGYQSDNPEIDSSFIDVFADEEPSGPRGPGAGQPPKTRVGTMPEGKAQSPLPGEATPPGAQAPLPGNGDCPARSRPKTRSLGPVPAEADGAGLVSQQRRGKRFKLFQKEPDRSSSTKSRKGPRATCLRPRRKGQGAEAPLPRPRDLRSHEDPAGQALPVETRSSQRIRLSPGKESRRRKVRGGSWSKELIHKIVQQKNKLHRGPRAQGGRLPLGPPRPAPSRTKDGLQELVCASESEEEDGAPQGSRLRGRPPPRQGCRRWRRGTKQKEVEVTSGSKEDGGPQKPRTVMRREATKVRASPSPEEPGRPHPGPKDRGPKHLLQVPASAKTPEENRPALDSPQDTQNSETAKELPPAATELPREAPSSSPASRVGGSPNPPALEPGREDPWVCRGSLLGAARCTEPPASQDREDPPAYPPGELLAPGAHAADTAYLESGSLFLKSPDLGCGPALLNGDCGGVPLARKGPQASSSPPSKLFLGPKELPGCLPEELYSKPLAPDALPASSTRLPRDAVDASALEPKPPRNPPYAIHGGPGKAESPLTLESTPLFPGLPEDRFDPPAYSSLSRIRDTHSSMVCADPPPRKPQSEPPYSPLLPDKGWSLLEESPTLASHMGHLPDLLGEKAFSRRCPRERAVAASPPPLPGKVSECGIAFTGNLSEGELEIKRLVAELESQLRSKGGPEAPEMCRAGQAGRTHAGTGAPLPTSQATPPPRDTFSKADLTSLGELTPQPEGAEPAVATTEGGLRSTQEEWPSPHPGEAGLSPRARADGASGAPGSLCGADHNFQARQRARVLETGPCKAEGNCGVHAEVSLPSSGELFKPPPDVRSLAKCSPSREPLLPQNNKTAKMHASHALQLEAFGSPLARLAPSLALQGTAPSCGAGLSDAPEGYSVSRAGQPEEAGLPHSGAGDPGLKGNEESVPVGASPSPACVPNTSPGRRPQDPATSPLRQLQLLVARASGKEEDALGSQGPLSADTQSPRRSEPSDLEGDSVEGGDMACSPTQDVPAAARCQWGPEADGHLDTLGQAEKPEDQGGASRPQPDNWGSPVGLDNLLMVSAGARAVLARLGGQLQGNSPVLGLRKEAWATPSPVPSDAETLVPTLVTAHVQNGPEARTSEDVASPGLEKQPLLAGDSLAPPIRDLTTCVPLPASAATPIPPGREHLPQEDPPTGPSGELRGLLPAPPSCGDPASPQLLPAPSPAWPPLQRADCTPATRDAGAGPPAAAPPSLRKSPCGFQESLARHPLLGDHSPLQDPPSGPPGFISVFTPAHGEDCPEGSMSGPLKGSRKEKPRGSPASATCSPPVRTISPRVTMNAPALPDIPTTDGMGAVRGPGVDHPDCQGGGALPHTSPSGMPTGPPSSDPPGNREGQGVTVVPADPSTWGTTGPDSCACQEGEAGAGCSGAMKAPGADTGGPPLTGPSTELRRGRTTSPSSTARESRPSSPQSLRTVHHTPQRDPLSTQGTRQKPGSPENAPRAGRAPSRQPVTCEVCTASFRSGPGLSRHRARKHGLHRGAPTLPAPRPPACQPPEKKCRRAPGREKPRQALSGPSPATGPPPDRGAKAPEDASGPQTAEGLGVGGTLGCSPGPGEPGLDMRFAEPRKQGRLVRDKHYPKQTEKGGGQRRGRAPTDVPSKSELKSQEKGQKPRTRRFREARDPPVCAGVISDRSRWGPSTATASPLGPPGSPLSVRAEPDPNASWPTLMENTVGTDPEEMAAQRSPRDWMARAEGTEWAPPGAGLGGQKTAVARECWGPREAGIPDVYKELSWAAGAEPGGDRRAAESGSGQGVGQGHGPPSSPPGPRDTHASAGGTGSSCPQGPLQSPEVQVGVQEHEGTIPEAPSPGLGDPLSVFDDEASFSQLFPLGDRLTRKKNPRVYGKRCKKPKAPPPLEPHSEVGGSVAPASACLPTDLSDSGSLCLSHEDPWGDEATGLPESFLLEGFLSSKVPGIDPWAPSPSLWALEPGPEVDCAEDVSPRHTEDQRSENIPELHMVPASWRDLDLQAPAEGMGSSLGDMSPEPPNLERERYDSGLPGNAVDLEMLGARLEVQDLCFLTPCDDPAGVLSTSFLHFRATVKPQEPRGPRAEAAAGAGGATGRDRHAKARRASYKCKVCFQRFRGLGELDLHKLAHSPSPPPTCYMCVERRFGSRELLREHLQEKHVQSKAGRWACGMCLREVTDVWMYNEHLREHALRFARKGQARRSLGDWEGDRSVTRFLGSIMGQASRPSGGKRSMGKSNGSPAETLGQQTGAGKEFQRETVKPKAPANDSNQDGTLTPDRALADSSPTACGNPALPSGSAKTSPSLSPEPCSGSEPLLHAIPVHEGCKDPSRDCHHCGKRFPKPFKLQRHLAVHSPQRVYLCPQCPRVYPEHQELRAHLGGAHGVREELELPHTPLYACELCANVTHISKRSFVCSSCNYTFAKKEQFDRHMEKHLRGGQQPFTFRGVRRPGAPSQKAPAREGTLPSKRRRVAVSSSPPGPGTNGPLSWGRSPPQSEGSLPGLLQPRPEAAPGTTKGQPRTPERLVDPVCHPVTGGDVPSDLQELLPPALSPFPAASADGHGGRKLEGALGRSEGEASPGSPGPLLQQALLLGGSVPRPGTRGQDVEEKRATGPFSGKRRTPSAPDRCLEAPSLLQEKQVSTGHRPEGGAGGPSHKGSAVKPWGCRNSSKDRSVLPSPSKAPRFPGQPKKVVASPTPRELTHGTEDRPKPTTLKAKPSPNSQGSGGPRHSTKTAGGSQPQPASGQLQSETATTPAKPNFPGQGPAPDKHPPRAKGSPKGPREAGDQGPRGSLSTREDGEASEKKRKGRAPGPSRSGSVGSLGRAHLVPEKPPRAPRKQATPSRMLPTKARPSSQSSAMPPQPTEQWQGGPGHTHGDCRRSKEGQGKACPQGRPLHRPLKRDRAVHGAEPANPRACRTAASQNDLLSQLFGQRLTSFKIPLKKDPPE